jgi:hypothetical protein
MVSLTLAALAVRTILQLIPLGPFGAAAPQMLLKLASFPDGNSDRRKTSARMSHWTFNYDLRLRLVANYRLPAPGSKWVHAAGFDLRSEAL